MEVLKISSIVLGLKPNNFWIVTSATPVPNCVQILISGGGENITRQVWIFYFGWYILRKLVDSSYRLCHVALVILSFQSSVWCFDPSHKPGSSGWCYMMIQMLATFFQLKVNLLQESNCFVVMLSKHVALNLS